MKPTDPIAPEQMLAALNGTYCYGKDRRNWAVLFGLKAAPATEYSSATQEFRRLLQEYVDMWLQTGCGRFGAERLSSRKPNMEVQAVVSEYLKAHPALPITFDRGYTVSIPFRIERFPSARRRKRAVFAVLPSGKRVRLVRGDLHQPRKDVEEDARRLFVGMLFTEWSLRIAKCRRPQCGLYYILKKPRRLYKRGTFCRRRNSLRAAAKRTEIVRRERQEARLRVSDEACWHWRAQNPAKQRRLGLLEKYILSTLNEKGHFVTAKWVTRNMKKIELRASQKRAKKA